MRSKLALAITAVVICLLVRAGQSSAEPTRGGEPTVLEQVPEAPDPTARYLFYLHGHILEGQGRRPRHPQYGVYEYDAILAALAKAGPTVVSEARPKNTAPARYAERVVSQIERLRAAGVPDDHITVVGFSRGGWIAQLVSAKLAAPVRYVLLAACPDPARPLPVLHGQVLSIREKSDSIPTCAPLFRRASPGTRTAEKMIDLGGGHGAFYRPNPTWLSPVLKFARTGA